MGKPDGAPLPLVTMLLVALAPSHVPFSSRLSQLLSMAGQMIWVGVAVGTPQGFSILRSSTRIVPVKVVPKFPYWKTNPEKVDAEDNALG